jgi:hypothetical protein
MKTHGEGLAECGRPGAHVNRHVVHRAAQAGDQLGFTPSPALEVQATHGAGRTRAGAVDLDRTGPESGMRQLTPAEHAFEAAALVLDGRSVDHLDACDRGVLQAQMHLGHASSA